MPPIRLLPSLTLLIPVCSVMLVIPAITWASGFAGPLMDYTDMPDLAVESRPMDVTAVISLPAVEYVEPPAPALIAGTGFDSPAQRILAKYHEDTLSVCPAMYFAPASLRIAFATTVNDPIDEHGNRLLHLASRSGNLSAVWYLLQVGAEPSLQNRLGRRPEDVAYRFNDQARDCILTALSSPDHSVGDCLSRRTSVE